VPEPHTARSQERGSDRRALTVASALLVAAVLAVYAQTLRFEWLEWDDRAHLLDNPNLALGLGWDGLRWAATSGWYGNWHPLTWLSFLAETQLFGANPAGFHAVGIALHAANALLLLFALRALTGRTAESALVAALFALHPQRAESVAWISERKDLLFALFGFACLWAYGRHALQPSRWRHALALALAAASLFSKTMLVTLPALLLLIDFWPLGRLARASLRARLLEKLPFLALALGAAGMILGLQSDVAPELSLPQRLAHGAMSMLFYVAKTLWPVSLSGFYPHPYLARSGGVAWTPLELSLGFAALAAISAFAWRERARRPHLLAGWLWFTGTLVPVLGLIQVGKQGYADRYSYFPQIGLWIAFVFELGRWLRARPDPLRTARRAAPAIALLLLALGALSHAQASTWRNSETLFAHAVALDPRNAVFRYNLARTLQLTGRGDAAIPHYRAVLEVDAEHTGAMNNLAMLLDARGDLAGARELYERALELVPDAAEFHYNFGNHLARSGDRAGAIRAYRRAIALDPAQVRARINLGNALRELGRDAAARNQYEKALEIDPENPAARRALDAPR
jgi:tetratricopeptide (TPR) repeat protein